MLTFRPIRPEDDAAVAALIRRVMPEFGADGPGFAIHDPEVDQMCAAYSVPGAAYFVVEDAVGRLVGGAGIAALERGEAGVCELRKMYFLPEARGQGMGESLLRHCLRIAQDLGYRLCYLETLTGMDQALRLYAKLGFQPLCAPLGRTGHGGCDHWFARELSCPDRRVTERALGEPAKSGPGAEGIKQPGGRT
jgi:putative acetyltransferase